MTHDTTTPQVTRRAGQLTAQSRGRCISYVLRLACSLAEAGADPADAASLSQDTLEAAGLSAAEIADVHRAAAGPQA